MRKNKSIGFTVDLLVGFGGVSVLSVTEDDECFDLQNEITILGDSHWFKTLNINLPSTSGTARVTGVATFSDGEVGYESLNIGELKYSMGASTFNVAGDECLHGCQTDLCEDCEHGKESDKLKALVEIGDTALGLLTRLTEGASEATLSALDEVSGGYESLKGSVGAELRDYSTSELKSASDAFVGVIQVAQQILSGICKVNKEFAGDVEVIELMIALDEFTEQAK